jgi:hypothetical protein
MSTSAITRSRSEAHTIGVARMGLAGALTGATVFIVCWIGVFIPFASPTHAYIGLFTKNPVSSAQALWEGLCWSLLFGGLTAVLFAFIYNATRALDRK